MSSVSWSVFRFASVGVVVDCVLLAGAIVLLMFGHSVRKELRKSSISSPKEISPYMSSESSELGVWTVFNVPHSAVSGISEGHPIATRFRLAGTFFAYTDGIPDTRKAIIDDLVHGIQKVVSEQDDLGDGAVVLKIEKEKVKLRDRTGMTAELRLSFGSSKRTSPTQVGKLKMVSASPSNLLSEAATRFGGERVGDQRWVFSREKLMDYYQELRDNPERLLSVFDSMKPVYDESRQITGYRLEVEGEPELFEAAGLTEGDIVRAVNFVEMRNRRRAEFLISQFIRNEANAFIFDIERNGEKKRLIYEIR